MSEVTSSIEEPIVRVSQHLMKHRQPTSTGSNRMLWLSILAGMIVLTAGEDTANEFNRTASESPVELITTEVPPPREAVTDLFTTPLAAFKVQVPLSPQLSEGEEGELVGLGKAENNTDTSSNPPFSNLWFNAGQSLGSAANSLTGWLNSRLGPQTTSTTTKPPEVIVRVQSHQGGRKPLIAIDNKRKTQDNRISPVEDNPDEEGDDDDEDVDDDEDYEEGEDDQEAEENSNSNRYSSNDDDEGDGENDDDEENDDDDEEDEPPKKRKNYKKKQKRRHPSTNRRGYDYEEDEYNEDYDDDEDYDYDLPNKHSGRQQQQQSLLNRFRQLAQMPYSSINKQQNNFNQQNKPGYRPVRIIQNGQVLQLVQDSPSKQQVNRRRRPSSNQNTFQLIPIRNNQLSNAGQKQKRKKVNKPDTSNDIVIPIPQGSSSLNSQKRPSQYITIPWSQLGITNQQQDYAQSGQQAAPIIVNIPQHAQQQNSNRRRRPLQNPTQTVSTPQRKRLRRPLKSRPQNGQLVSLLTDQNIRDIFRVPEIPPSRTPQENIPIALGGKRKRPIPADEVQSEDATTVRPAQPDLEEEDDDSNQEEQEPYIVVGDDDAGDEPLPRHAMPNRYHHIGGMKPYVDVLNKGRIYLKSGRQMRADSGQRAESKITSIDPEPAVVADRSPDITTESSSETKANAPPTILVAGLDNASTTGNPLPQ